MTDVLNTFHGCDTLCSSSDGKLQSQSASEGEKDALETSPHGRDMSTSSADELHSQSASEGEKAYGKDMNLNEVPSTQSSEEDDYFTCSLPCQPCFFFIERKERQRLRQNQKGRHFQRLQ
ncbi:uncharacterized protein [Misgurnus anguillicaudatus]|uniref:uncharacterized protein isoform X2 n=1 Tax=Misgurnus anguillicaudatus TaxID=75329 RepID=UPI003CCFAABD